jgi:hypothetical protein
MNILRLLRRSSMIRSNDEDSNCFSKAKVLFQSIIKENHQQNNDITVTKTRELLFLILNSISGTHLRQTYLFRRSYYNDMISNCKSYSSLLLTFEVVIRNIKWYRTIQNSKCGICKKMDSSFHLIFDANQIEAEGDEEEVLYWNCVKCSSLYHISCCKPLLDKEKMYISDNGNLVCHLCNKVCSIFYFIFVLLNFLVNFLMTI